MISLACFYLLFEKWFELNASTTDNLILSYDIKEILFVLFVGRKD